MVVDAVVEVATGVGGATIGTVGWSIGIALIRSVCGWVENALENGKIDTFEIKKLGETIFRVIPQSIGLVALVGPAGQLGVFFTDYLLTKYMHRK